MQPIAAFAATILIITCGCQTMGQGASPDPMQDPPPEQTMLGFTLYGPPLAVPCREGSAWLDRRSRPTVEAGVEADILGNRLRNPRPYAEATCLP